MIVKLSEFLHIRFNFKKIFLCAYVISLIFLFIYQVNSPLSLLPIAGHDDGLFMAMARSIVKGHWLGDFNQFTLMKGVGLPFILAILAIFKIPLSMFYATLIIVICEMLRRATLGLFNNYYLAILTALLVGWYPGLDSTRVLRDTLFTWEVVLAAVLFLYFTIHFNRKSIYLNVLGLIIGYAFITREEGLTVFIPFVTAVALFIYLNTDVKTLPVKRGLAVFGVFMLFAFLPLSVVSSINYLKYGKFIDNDFKETNFVKTLTILQSIEPVNKTEYLPVPKDVRLSLYQSSHKFLELKEFLDGENAPLNGWQKPSCERFPNTCGDYGGPWFFWAFRDAVKLAGYYKSPVSTSDYYKQLNIEIAGLCNAGKLKCTTKISPLPNISVAQLASIPSITMRVVKNVTLITPPDLYNMPSMGSDDQIQKAANFLNVTNFTASAGASEFNDNSKINKKNTHRYLNEIVNIKSYLFKIYSKILPSLFVAGATLTCLILIARICSIEMIFILTLLWALPILRIAMLVITTASGFGDIFHFYIGFIGPMLIVASTFSLFIFLSNYYKYKNYFLPIKTNI